MYLALFCVECVRSCASSVQGVFLWDVPQCRVVRKFFGHSHVRRIACIRAGYCLFPVCVNVVGWSVFLACWRGNVLFVSLCRVVLCCVVFSESTRSPSTPKPQSCFQVRCCERVAAPVCIL